MANVSFTWKCPAHNLVLPNRIGCPECVKAERARLHEKKIAHVPRRFVIEPKQDKVNPQKLVYGVFPEIALDSNAVRLRDALLKFSELDVISSGYLHEELLACAKWEVISEKDLTVALVKTVERIAERYQTCIEADCTLERAQFPRCVIEAVALTYAKRYIEKIPCADTAQMPRKTLGLWPRMVALNAQQHKEFSALAKQSDAHKPFADALAEIFIRYNRKTEIHLNRLYDDIYGAVRRLCLDRALGVSCNVTTRFTIEEMLRVGKALQLPLPIVDAHNRIVGSLPHPVNLTEDAQLDADALELYIQTSSTRLYVAQVALEEYLDAQKTLQAEKVHWHFMDLVRDAVLENEREDIHYGAAVKYQVARRLAENYINGQRRNE